MNLLDIFVIIISVLILSIGSLIHEFGHYFAYLFFKKNPSIKFKYGAIIIGENNYHSLSPLQALIINISGILFGLIFFLIIKNIYLIFIYLICCCIDITNIFSLIPYLKKEFKNKTILDIYEIKLNKLKKNIII